MNTIKNIVSATLLGVIISVSLPVYSTGEPPVKKSKSGICHPKFVPWRLAQGNATIAEGTSPADGLVEWEHLKQGDLYELHWGLANTREYLDYEIVFTQAKHAINIPNNWITVDHQYADGQAVPQAKYSVYDSQKNFLANGKLNHQGKATVALDTLEESVYVRFHDDPKHPLSTNHRQISTKPALSENTHCYYNG